MTLTIAGKDDLMSRVGQELGTSDWFVVTQEKVDQFAEATGDHQWIHVDPLKAADGPFGGTVAHGYFTLSLAPALFWQIVTVEGVTMGVNYGSNKVRFISPVKVGKRVRLKATLLGAEAVEPNSVQATYNMVFEIEGEKRPACVGEIVTRYYF